MKVNKVVFFASAAVILLFVLFGAVFTETAHALTTTTQTVIATYLGWFYELAMAFFLGFVIWLLFSRHADIRLGAPGETPKYNYVTWISMLFSAGIGIGLLFFGVAEPLYHFTHPPHQHGFQPGSVHAAQHAIAVTFFHWGLHGWSLYVIVGLSLAYFGYRRDLPLTFRSTLYPVLEERIHDWPGDLIEVLAVFGTMFGVATSLGLGVIHVNTGLEMFGWLESSARNQILLIAVITLGATISVVSGLDRGIRRLSELNFALGIVLLAIVFALGPGLFLIRAYVQQIGYYLQHLVQLSLTTGAYAPDAAGLSSNIDWQKAWTVFYWGWWISWCPFVGMFIARISRGRTIREFIVGVLLVPCAFITFWMSTFGNTALYLQKYDAGVAADVDLVARITDAEGTFQFFRAFYVMLESLPWSTLTMGIATVSGVIYFITSSDSASLIIDILTSDNDPDPPVAQRIFWALTEGAVAAVLIATGGKKALTALQTGSIAAAVPFSLVALAICYCLVVGLRRDEPSAEGRRMKEEGRRRRDEARRDDG
ncbi:MAG: BCCT family transporter [Bradymonadaceae bacterium]